MQSNLPVNYQFLSNEPAPKMLLEALKLYGTKEMEGEKDNPVILHWASEAGVTGYNSDSIPWCGLFMAIVAHRAGKKVPDHPLWARNWADFGKDSDPELGAVLVFTRGNSGHVGLYVGEDKLGFFHVLGGNQGDAVSITRIPKERLISSRVQYNTRPANVRRIYLDPEGAISKSEA